MNRRSGIAVQIIVTAVILAAIELVSDISSVRNTPSNAVLVNSETVISEESYK